MNYKKRDNGEVLGTILVDIESNVNNSFEVE